MKEKLESRKVAVEEEQALLEKDFNALKEQRADLDRKLSAIQARFNGNLRVLNELAELMKSPPEEPPQAD